MSSEAQNHNTSSDNDDEGSVDVFAPSSSEDSSSESEPEDNLKREDVEKVQKWSDMPENDDGLNEPADAAEPAAPSVSVYRRMKEDPSYVPRESRYFFHDDRNHTDDEEDQEVPRAVETVSGKSKKLWTPDEDSGRWTHDLYDVLVNESSVQRGSSYNNRRGGRRRNRGYPRSQNTEYRQGRNSDSRDKYNNENTQQNHSGNSYAPQDGYKRGGNRGQRRTYVVKEKPAPQAAQQTA